MSCYSNNAGEMAKLTTEQAKFIAKLPSGIAAEEALRRSLNLPPCDRAKDIQYGLYLEIVYGHMRFAIDKGFTWPQICEMPYIAGGLLQRIKVLKLRSFVTYMTTWSKYGLDVLGDRNLKLYWEFVCNNLVQHFLLYKHVFCSVPRKATQISRTVHTPTEPEPLSEGKPIEIWNYERQLTEIAQEEKELCKMQEVVGTKCPKEIFDEFLGDPAKESFTEENLESLVKNLSSVYCNKIQDMLVANIEHKHQEMLLNIKRVLLPRPPAMGPPTKLKPKGLSVG